MRIISGSYRGKRLSIPKGKTFRPTQDRVREAFFNIIGPRVTEGPFLDLCCGSGAVGIEAISRGAPQATLVDVDISSARKNLETIEGNHTAIQRDIRSFLKQCSDSFSIIYLDPPWPNQDLYPVCIDLIMSRKLLHPEGWLICEHARGYDLKHAISYPIEKQYTYGEAILSLILPSPVI